VRLNGHSESCVNRFSGRVAEFIYLGDHVRVRLEVCGKADFFVKQPIADLDPAWPWATWYRWAGRWSTPARSDCTSPLIDCFTNPVLWRE
jgi:proline racemase